MPHPYAPEDVFTPAAYPQHTYVSRTDRDFERELRDSLAVTGQLTSIIGPSKSGKTVLVERVVGPSSIVPISGSNIHTADDLWREILDHLDLPMTTTEGKTTASTKSASVEAGGELQIPLVVKGSTKGSGVLSSENQTERQEERQRRGLGQVVDAVAGTQKVILIDDFHYVPREVQISIARQLKEGIHHGLHVCVASIPHRSEDIIRANADLRGRVAGIDIGFWTQADLEAIARLGFELLNVELDRAILRTFAVEAAGSPQLMQAICLTACREMNLSSGLAKRQAVTLDDEAVARILKRTTALADRKSLTTILRSGPKERGTSRLKHTLRDGSEGDVYECVIRAVAADPPILSFSYGELKRRTDELAGGEGPRGSAVIGCVVQMHQLAKVFEPDERVIEWDEERQILTIIDPYLYFYLRWS